MDNTMIIEEYFSEELGERVERIACPLCGENDASEYRVSHDRLFGSTGKYRVVCCRRCAMIYTNPRPTFEALARHYPDDYFCYTLPDTLSGIRRHVFSGVTNRVTRRRLRMIEQVIGTLRPGIRACDVGCSFGELLFAFKNLRKCDVVGVDLSASMVTYCERRGVAAIRGTLKDAALRKGSIDLITMTEYLEHDGDPKSVLQECRRVTTTNGYLAIEIPLISSFVARVFGNYWSQLDLPRHLMFFTQDTLKRMLQEVGYEVLSTRTMVGSIASSLLHAMGYERMGRLTTRDIIMLFFASIPVLPIQPFLPEFMFIVARATD
jgi:2-polyprenyl-3-methyl-5-hydroxy-6-metoxy-1,4-benzoquinol methylase